MLINYQGKWFWVEGISHAGEELTAGNHLVFGPFSFTIVLSSPFTHDSIPPIASPKPNFATTCQNITPIIIVLEGKRELAQDIRIQSSTSTYGFHLLRICASHS